MGNLKKVAAALVCCLGVAGSAHAFCFQEAGEMYNINPQILRAIAKVESNFNYKALHQNTNGTYDVGLMQINSGWASVLGEERWKQLGEACYNTKTGAWILSQCIAKYGYNWKAIGCYHSQTPAKRDQYAQMVFNQLQKVAPVAQEAAYAPLKSQLTALVQQEVDKLVNESVKKNMAQLEEPAPQPSGVEQPPAVEQPPETPPEPPQEPQMQQPQEPQPQEPQMQQPDEPQPQPQEVPQEVAPQEDPGAQTPPVEQPQPIDEPAAANPQ